MQSSKHAESGVSVGSPYAAALQSGASNGPFSPELEAEYIADRLLSNRTLIRMACLLAVLATLFRAAENTLAGAWTATPVGGWTPVLFGLVTCASLLLVWLAWRPALERRYLPVAQVIVPVRNVILAVLVVGIAVRGQLELLMILPLLVIGPFYFLGLQFRAALISVLLTVIAVAASSFFFELPVEVFRRTCVFLLLTVVACAIAARALERLSRRSFLESRLIAEMAQCDALTGTNNRRVFDEQFARLWRQATDDQRPLAIALIDVDHFKAYNDHYGHQAGDRTLQRVAQALQEFVSRPLDVLARYGGEEFGVILYDVEEGEALALADRMRRAVASLAIEHRSSQTESSVTISIGVAFVRPSNERRSRGALQLADEALYVAKVGGRNRVELKGGEEYEGLVTGVFSRSPFAGQP